MFFGPHTDRRHEIDEIRACPRKISQTIIQIKIDPASWAIGRKVQTRIRDPPVPSQQYAAAFSSDLRVTNLAGADVLLGSAP